MSTVFRGIFVVVMFSVVMSFMVHLNSDSYTRTTVKSAAEVASHDALLQYIPEYFSEGKIVFDKGYATTSFLQSLHYNLRLGSGSNTTLPPTKKSFLREDLKVNRLVFIDNNTRPSDVRTGQLKDVEGGPVKTYEDGTVRFPLVYVDHTYEMSSGWTSYRNANGELVTTKITNGVVLERPGVVSVLETYAPRWFKGQDTRIRQASVYNFKLAGPTD